MPNQQSQQATIVTGTTRRQNQQSIQLALFNADGSPASTVKTQAAPATAAAADIAGVNTYLNALVAKLKTAGVFS